MCPTRRNRRIAWFVLVVVLATSSCAIGGASDSQPESSSWAPFANAHFDYEPFDTLRNMVMESDLIVVGEVVSLRSGRALGGLAGQQGTIETTTARVAIQENVRGGELRLGKFVDVEFLRSNGAGSDELVLDAPSGQALYFLQDVAKLPVAKPVSIIPAVGELYVPATPMGLFVEKAGAVGPALLDESEPVGDSSFRAKTLAELVDRVRSY